MKIYHILTNNTYFLLYVKFGDFKEPWNRVDGWRRRRDKKQEIYL